MSFPSGASRARKQSGYARQDQAQIWRAGAAHASAFTKMVIVRTDNQTGEQTETTLTKASREICIKDYDRKTNESYACFCAFPKRPYAMLETISDAILREKAIIHTEKASFQLQEADQCLPN